MTLNLKKKNFHKQWFPMAAIKRKAKRSALKHREEKKKKERRQNEIKSKTEEEEDGNWSGQS